MVQKFSFKPCSSLSLLLAERFLKRAHASSVLSMKKVPPARASMCFLASCNNTVESLSEFPIFYVGGWEICHETMIALPCLGESLVRKLLEAHPRISSVALLADLSDERSQKSCRDKS
jgi:hypothetical protein